MLDAIFDSALLSMCMTWRHDFGLLDRKDQMAIRKELLGLYCHHVKPLAEENAVLRAEMKRLCSSLNAALHPNGDGPESPSLCDLVAFVKADMATLRARAEKAEAERDFNLEQTTFFREHDERMIRSGTRWRLAAGEAIATAEGLMDALDLAEDRAIEGSLACSSCDWMGHVSECEHSPGEALGRCDCPECGGDAEGAFWWRHEYREMAGLLPSAAYQILGSDNYNESPAEFIPRFIDRHEELKDKLAKAEAERDSLRAWREKVLSQRVSVFGLTTFLNEIEREEWADEVARLLSAIESKPGGEE